MQHSTKILWLHAPKPRKQGACNHQKKKKKKKKKKEEGRNFEAISI
jgi:hypothetical protein